MWDVKFQGSLVQCDWHWWAALDLWLCRNGYACLLPQLWSNHYQASRYSGSTIPSICHAGLFPAFLFIYLCTMLQLMGDYPGVPGLFVAAVFSGALSTVSSGLNSLSAVCLKDFAQTGLGLNLSEARATFATKVFSVVFGFISYGIVFFVKYLPGVLEVSAYTPYIFTMSCNIYSGCSRDIRDCGRSCAGGL